jgi:hypothetical protein
MSLKIQSIDESIEDDGIKTLVYGMLGSGKTRLCASLATLEQPILIVNVEGGLLSLQDLPEEQKKHISVVKASNFKDMEDILNYLRSELLYAWVCIDSISEVAEVVLYNEKQANSDGRAAYGNLADIMNEMLRDFRDLPDYNVMMTAKMTRFTDEITNRTMYWPLMPGKQLTNGIGYIFDEVFALRVEQDADGNTSRWLQTSRDIQYEAKDRSGRLDMFEPPDMPAIAQKITTGIPVEEANAELQAKDAGQNEEENENGENAK